MNLEVFSDVWIAENQVSRGIVFHDEKETGGNKNSRVLCNRMFRPLFVNFENVTNICPMHSLILQFIH